MSTEQCVPSTASVVATVVALAEPTAVYSTTVMVYVVRGCRAVKVNNVLPGASVALTVSLGLAAKTTNLDAAPLLENT